MKLYRGFFNNETTLGKNKTWSFSKRVLTITCVLFLLPCFSLFAEHEFSLRLAPAFEFPVGNSQFETGFGAAASFDWAFWPFAKKFDLGLSLGGGFTNIAVKVGDSVSLIDGKLGPFVRWRLFDRWTFRAGLGAGVYQYSRGEDKNTKAQAAFALGAEFHLSPYFSLFADGGFTYRTFGTEASFSSPGVLVGLRMNLSEILRGATRVKLDKTEQYRVFPVSWAWYEHNPIATVEIVNEEPNAITDVSLSFFMDSYMSQPWTFAALSRLSSGESVQVPVTALFNEAMLNLTENINANGIIQIQYRSLGARKETDMPIQMPIFHRNTLSWDDDRRAAAFVSPRDSSARLFARYVASAVDAQLAQTPSGIPNAPDNVRYAVAMFEALRLYGMSYVIVPATSYARLQSDESALDNVSYPYQALYYRGGDCSYLSILYCSLLEALDIETAFITVPGHIYAAFEIGDNNWMARNSDIIEIEGSDGIRRRWLPLEITATSEGFTRGWRIGAREWVSAGAAAQLYPIRECWKVYPPVTAPGSGDTLPEMPPRADIVGALRAELSR